MAYCEHGYIQVKSKGVDAVGGGFANPGPMLKQLARAERTLRKLPRLYLFLMYEIYTQRIQAA